MTAAYYTAGDGYVLHHSGMKLNAALALTALGKHLATTRNNLASAAEIDVARTCVDEITAAMEASFPDNTEAPMEDATPKQRRGFAAMTPERRREIARKGGGSVPAEKRAYAKNRELAASAGKKGGEVSRGARRAAGGAG